MGEHGRLVDDDALLPDLVQLVFYGSSGNNFYVLEGIDLRVSERWPCCKTST